MRTGEATRAPHEVLGMSAYASCEFGIRERRHVRDGALYERKPAPSRQQEYGRKTARARRRGLFYRSSSCNSSRCSVSSALRCNLSSASSLARAISSTRVQNPSAPTFCFSYRIEIPASQHTLRGGKIRCRLRTPLWNWARSSRLRRSNSPDFLNLCVSFFRFAGPEYNKGQFTL